MAQAFRFTKREIQLFNLLFERTDLEFRLGRLRKKLLAESANLL